jgi:hypothetical protein
MGEKRNSLAGNQKGIPTWKMQAQRKMQYYVGLKELGCKDLEWIHTVQKRPNGRIL